MSASARSVRQIGAHDVHVVTELSDKRPQARRRYSERPRPLPYSLATLDVDSVRFSWLIGRAMRIEGTARGLLTNLRRPDCLPLLNLVQLTTIRQSCVEGNVDPRGLVLHSDNGAAMRGSTMISTLQWLGVIPSCRRLEHALGRCAACVV